MDKLGIRLPEVDRKRTQEAVEAALETYRIFKYIGFEMRETNVTSLYEPRYNGRTNRTSNETAKIAVYTTNEPERRRRYCENIEQAVSRLHPKQQLLITERYMKSDYVFDYVVYNQVFDPPISADTYAKIRWRAFYLLALALDIAVPKGNG
ncbi:transcriptional regulator [Gordoniibacillus kamchatkensis]|uniref:Transcriptional regulator n=2 Tax=Gordoniibacillus kamchatkensis TaxID=1590651 RepID=A0ABR5A3F1_9BACL|nr:transcriptional regulator [Paenibacillus sp. VKM B-2647]